TTERPIVPVAPVTRITVACSGDRGPGGGALVQAPGPDLEAAGSAGMHRVGLRQPHGVVEARGAVDEHAFAVPLAAVGRRDGAGREHDAAVLELLLVRQVLLERRLDGPEAVDRG